jgi:hypothetical protein
VYYIAGYLAVKVKKFHRLLKDDTKKGIVNTWLYNNIIREESVAVAAELPTGKWRQVCELRTFQDKLRPELVSQALYSYVSYIETTTSHNLHHGTSPKTNKKESATGYEGEWKV